MNFVKPPKLIKLLIYSRPKMPEMISIEQKANVYLIGCSFFEFRFFILSPSRIHKRLNISVLFIQEHKQNITVAIRVFNCMLLLF